MKQFLLLFLLAIGFVVNARQLFTIKSGSWEADSVWSNNQTPGGFADTISIYHRISVHSKIILEKDDYLFIDSTGWLCGDDSLMLSSGAFLFNKGFLGMYFIDFFSAKGINLAPGYIDVGNAGIIFHGPDFRFIDSLGCMKVHKGRQTCNYPCSNDTSLKISSNFNKVIFETNLSEDIYHQYDFGDGSTESTWDATTEHTYANKGDYLVTLILESCCGRDTIRRLIHVELPPPACVNNQPFLLYPNPADEGFWIKTEFCEDEEVTVKLYTIAGQLTTELKFVTSLKNLKAFIPCKILAQATYIVAIQSSSKQDKKRVVVIHL